MIPNLVSSYDSDAKTLAISSEAGEARLILGTQLAPCSGKLLNARLDAEVILKNLLE